ncbi:MAG: hypothetical protein ABR534_12690 [Desulfotignum sp.]|nr:hypothetical protein [Desulfobacteraceae bacterium]
MKRHKESIKKQPGKTGIRSSGHLSRRFWMDRRPNETVVFPGTGESEKERQALWHKLQDKISQLRD